MKELFTLYIIEDSYLQTFSHSLILKDAILPLITKHRLNATTRQCFCRM